MPNFLANVRPHQTNGQREETILGEKNNKIGGTKLANEGLIEEIRRKKQANRRQNGTRRREK